MSGYTVQPARYAKGKLLLQAPSDTMFKSREARIAEGCGGRYTNRERGYIMSPRAVERFRAKLAAGWDWSPISKEWEPPNSASPG